MKIKFLNNKTKMKKNINKNKFIQIQDNPYDFIKITPIIGLRNFNNSNFMSVVHRIMFNFNLIEVKFNDKDKFRGIDICKPNYFSYIINASKDKVEFIFKVPRKMTKAIIPKFQENFEDCLIGKIDYKEENLPISRYMTYREEHPLSLMIDSKQQSFINSIIQTLDYLDKENKFKIEISVNPLSRIKRFRFRDKTKEVETKIKQGKSVKICRTPIEGLTTALIDFTSDIVGSLSNKDSKTTNTVLDYAYILSNQDEFKKSNSTMKKKKEDLFETTIKITTNSSIGIKQLENCFSLLDDDNSLIPVKSMHKNIMSCSELGQLIQIVGNKELMNKYNIYHLKYKQLSIPSELRKGSIQIGLSPYKEQMQKVYLSDNGENKYLSTVYVGPTRCGKTSLIQNTCRDCILNGDSVIFFDYIADCIASDEILSVIPKDKVCIIDISNCEEGLDFNEIVLDPKLTVEERYILLKRKASGIVALVDSCNFTNDEELKSQMRKILMSMCMVVFSQNKTFKDIINGLQDHLVRKNLIKNIPIEYKIKLDNSIKNLLVLDSKSKTTGKTTDTKLHLVNSILNRLYALQMNAGLEKMLERDGSKNINFIDEMQKGKFIVIRIPDIIASTNTEKDILCAYYFNRVWFSLQQRLTVANRNGTTKDLKRVLICVDEIYQVNNTRLLFKERINQISKYRGKLLLSCHSMEQIKDIKNELTTSDATFIIISGSSQKDLKHLEDKFGNKYTAQDLENLPKYNALCSIKTFSQEYFKCILALPAPIVKK